MVMARMEAQFNPAGSSKSKGQGVRMFLNISAAAVRYSS